MFCITGVPFTTKESTACEGLSNTFALVCRKGIKATEDADVVKLMKKAGGILLGKWNKKVLRKKQINNSNCRSHQCAITKFVAGDE